ncbi:MAG: helix-turn-helix transcriptional regulator [Clostridia bacterium]|nr:helix-turn-helix transcriptional regulator [Clostridia bacterium]
MLCDQLKYVRKANKFTQQQVADAINIERSTYASYETGRNRPDVNTLSSFAKTFGVTVDFIVNLDTSVPMSDIKKKYDSGINKKQMVLSQLNSDEKNIIAYFRNCSKQEKQEILDLISKKK